MKIGLFGGTFNPIHLGHLVLAQECWARLTLDKVVFIPAFLPPHKTIEGDIPAADRLNMVRLALEGDKRFEISTYEMDRGETCYTVDSIKHFIAHYGDNNEFFFIAGDDSAADLASWKDPDGILKLAGFVSATRKGFSPARAFSDRIIKIAMPEIEISSSDLRRRIREREPIDFLIPDKVVRYIRNKGLYR